MQPDDDDVSKAVLKNLVDQADNYVDHIYYLAPGYIQSFLDPDALTRKVTFTLSLFHW